MKYFGGTSADKLTGDGMLEELDSGIDMAVAV